MKKFFFLSLLLSLFSMAFDRAAALPLMGKHFDAKYPTFPYGSTDPYGYAYCVVSTNLYYTPQKPYVRTFLPTTEKTARKPTLKKSSRPSPNLMPSRKSRNLQNPSQK